MASIDNISSLLDLLAKIRWATETDINDLLDLSKRLKLVIDNSEHKPKYGINILDITNIAEPLTSKLIALMFEYTYHNDKILCRSFLDKFLVPCGLQSKWIKRPIITAEKEKVDIGIKENGKYAVVIENKLKGAPFQRNQLARYIQRMKDAGYKDEQIFVVILSSTTERALFDYVNKSVWFLPPDWKKPNDERECKGSDHYCCKCDEGQSCDNCLACINNYRDLFSSRTIVLNTELIEWMEDCLLLIPEDEDVLRAAIKQFSDFLKGRYNKRYNEQLTMEIVDFLRKQLIDETSSSIEKWDIIEKKKKEVQELMNGLDSLQTELGLDMIDQWRKQLDVKWSKWLKHEDHKSFGINIQGIWCGCWCENQSGPFWGFYNDSFSEEQKKIIDEIITHAGEIDYKAEAGQWYRWNYTNNGAEICDTLYQSAFDLGLLK